MLMRKWFETATSLGVTEPYGTVLSTVDDRGRPSSRVVLLKEVDDEGIVFGTSATSKKGRDFSDNPWAAGTIWWKETMQQMNFQGLVARMSPDASNELFKARPHDAQAMTIVSNQSAVMTDEHELESRALELASSSKTLRRPETWHAYHLAIGSIEFWHGRKNRLHRRLRYELADGVWTRKMLQP